MELCAHCGLEWNKPVSVVEIPKIEKKLDARILILDMEKIPMLNTTIGIYETLMYKNDEVKSNKQFWLLHDSDHYHAINNIKKFLAIEYFVLNVYMGKKKKSHLKNMNAAKKMDRPQDASRNKSKALG